MIKEVAMYTVVCDNCGKDNGDGNDIACWPDDFSAIEDAQNNEWHKEGELHYCTDCFSYDKDGELIINTKRTKQQ